MTVQRIKQDLARLKEEAANKPDLWMFFKSKEEELKAREEMKKEIGELEGKLSVIVTWEFLTKMIVLLIGILILIVWIIFQSI